MNVGRTLVRPLEFLLRRTQKSRMLTAVVVAALSWFAFAVTQYSGAWDQFELNSLDLRFHVLPRLHHADSSIVLIAIDQNSLDFFERQSVRWPWPRQFYGLLVEYLHRAGARVIAFDVDFSGHDIDRLEIDGAESDSAFAYALGRAGNVVLTAQLAVRGEGDQVGGTIDGKFFVQNSVPGEGTPQFNRIVAPIPDYQAGASRLGVVNFESDADGIARRVSLAFRFGERSLPHFGLACLAEAGSLQNGQIDSLLRSRAGSGDATHILYWYGRGGPEGAFRYYSAHALILSALKLQQGLPPDVPAEVFRNKIVIIGGSAAGLFDYKPTPFTSIEPYPGMEIHATLLSNLLNDHAIRESQPVWLYVLAFLLSLGGAAIFFRTEKVRHSVTQIIVLGALYAGLTLVFFYQWGQWLPLVGPEVSLAGTFLTSAIVSYATEGRQKRQLRKAFNRYLSPQVVTEIVKDIDQIELGGKLIEGTVYFSDIKNFTTISEQHSAKELVGLLNEYLSLASECILRNNAMLDKYIGDAVMAIFSAPIPRPDHARIACLTALEVQGTLTKYYEHKANHGGILFETRIGLNSGNMIVGNIGHTSRLDYTAIGDTVNLASRLEGVNKVFGTRILISESTSQGAGDAVRVRELDLLRVKGKNTPIRIYELVAENTTLSDALEEQLGLFTEGLRTYRAKDFAAAVHLFEKILRINPQDGPSLTYIDRCRRLSQERLPEDWDGVYTLTTK